jgi:hypothetical protein
MGLRAVRVAAACLLLAVACSSGGSNASSASLTGTWCGATFGGYIFNADKSCSYLVELGQAGPNEQMLCGANCSYSLAGSTLTILSSQDGGATSPCTYTLSFSADGSTLSLAPTGGSAVCAELAMSATRSSANNQCDWNCAP